MIIEVADDAYGDNAVDNVVDYVIDYVGCWAWVVFVAVVAEKC